jgi:large subunit ribosomal protein L29
MKIAEIAELTNNEIVEKLDKSYLELVQLRMKLTSRQLEDTSLIRKKKKEIARLLTVQTQKVKNGETKKEEVKQEAEEVKTKSKPKSTSKKKTEVKATKIKKEAKKKGSK